MDFPLAGLDQSEPEQEIQFETMATNDENAEPPVNDDNHEEDFLPDPLQEAAEVNVNERGTQFLRQMLSMQQAMQQTMSTLSQQLTNASLAPGIQLGLPPTPVNATTTTTTTTTAPTGIQTIPRERPPATPRRAAVSQYVGS